MTASLDSPGETASKLLRALRTFDEEAAPQGLYAISERRGSEHPDPINWGDWNFVIRPTLVNLGITNSRSDRIDIGKGIFEIGSRTCHPLTLHYVRLSKIKVRQFGNTYRLDRRQDFSDRWEAAQLQSHLYALAKKKDQERLLILLGFSQESRPFRNELTELSKLNKNANDNRVHFIETWLDPHQRGFRTLCAMWQWPR